MRRNCRDFRSFTYCGQVFSNFPGNICAAFLFLGAHAVRTDGFVASKTVLEVA